MKKLIIGSSTAQNRYWSILSKEVRAIWLVKNRSQRRLIELQKSGMDVIDLAGWCEKVISASGLANFKIMEHWQQLAMLRMALADSRSQTVTGLHQFVEFPGSQKRLLAKIQQMESAQFSPEYLETNTESERYAVIRHVYQEYQMDANLWDEHLVLTKFIEFLGEPQLVESIKNWAATIKADDIYKTLVIPRAEKYTGIEQTIVLYLCDFLEFLQVGIETQKYATNERKLKSTEAWVAAAREFETVILEDSEEIHKARHFHFGNMAAEKSALSSFLIKMREENQDGKFVVYIPGEKQEAEQFSSAMRQSGITCSGPRVALIEKPEVRTFLDIGIGIRDNWPAIQVVDLIRNSSFQFETIDRELTRRVVDRIAGDIYRLGEVCGISEIRKSLNSNWDAAKRFRVDAPSEKQQLQSMNLLAEIEKLGSHPDGKMLWSDWVGWLQAFVTRLLGIEFKDRLDELWDVLLAYSEMESALGPKEWLFIDFLGEVQLLLELAEIPSHEDDGAEVILYQEKLPDFSVVGEWVCCGMTEKHFPSRARLREGLRKRYEMSVMWENELNEFSGLCGLAFSNLIFTSSKINFKGDELNPSGLLQTIEKGVWNSGEWQKKQNIIDSLSPEASRFFTRGISLFNNRKNRDSRYLGMLSSNSSINRLNEYFNSHYGFSSTSLESASLCPFQFFAAHVLKIDTTEVNDDLGTNYLMEGNVIHAILEDIHRCIPVLDSNCLTQIRQLLGEKLDEYFQSSENVKESNPALARWRIQRRRIELKLSGYIDQLAKQINVDQQSNGHSARVVGVELNTRAGNIRIDPLVLLDEKTGLESRVHGRIDRVDLLSEADQSRVRIIDYKSGNRISASEIQDRLHLQLPLYAMMLDGFKLKDAANGKEIELSVGDIGFWYLKKSIGGYKSILKNDFNLEKMAEEYKEIILDLVRKIRDGEFKINPKIPKCEEKCSMNEICRIREIRVNPEMRL